MHPLLASLTGKSAVNNYRQHLRDASKAVKKLNAASYRAHNFPNEINASREAFLKTPTEPNFETWLRLESRRAAMFAISQNLAQTAQHLLAERQHSGGGTAKLLAAADEVEAVLRERRETIVAEDEKRSIELGETVDSGPALASIDKMLDRLINVRGHAEHMFATAMSTFNTIIGPDPEEAFAWKRGRFLPSHHASAQPVGRGLVNHMAGNSPILTDGTFLGACVAGFSSVYAE